MKKLTCFLALFLVAISLFGQANMGTLKIFSDEPIIVYVDQVQIPKYSEIPLVSGTHYVKAINANEERIYSEIVTIGENKVTTIFIETPKDEPVAVIQPQPVQVESAPPAVETPKPENQIFIGQVDGLLPKDMDAPLALKFGMNSSSVNSILEPQAAQMKKSKGFTDYAISTTEGYCIVETRYIDDKLFDIVIGYATIYEKNNKAKLSKNELPFDAFNKMYATIVAHYGEPTTVIRHFKDGYAENDGKLLEALKKKKAMIYYFWAHPETGNDISLTMAYTTAPMVAMAYTSGALEKEAKSRNLVINEYNYGKTFDENYYKK
jgi:hypothetical protein